MARTALGTAKAKASGTTLASAAAVSLNEGDCLIVGVGFQQTNLPTSVTWGARALTKAVSQINSTSGHGCGIYVARAVANTDSRTVTATWASAIGARVMVMLKIDAGMIRDQYATSTQTASSAPAVGPTSALEYPDDFALTMFCAEGPSGDTAPTVSGWTTGQSDGNVGAPPISNITLHEFYQQIDCDRSAVTCTGSGATARDWASCVVTLREISEAAPIDINGWEIEVGDTVNYGLGSDTSTVSSFTRSRGHPFVKCVLANGLVYNAHTLEVK